MQITHDTDGEGLPNFPGDIESADVNVYMHSSGMLCTHDYSCPCCRDDSAVLDLSTGLMLPCRTCNTKYSIINHNNFDSVWHVVKKYLRSLI